MLCANSRHGLTKFSVSYTAAHRTLEDFVVKKTYTKARPRWSTMGEFAATTMPVTLKLYRKSKLSTLNRFQVLREIRLHIALYHEHIINMYGAFEDEKYVYLVLEMANGVSPVASCLILPISYWYLSNSCAVNKVDYLQQVIWSDIVTLASLMEEV